MSYENPRIPEGINVARESVPVEFLRLAAGLAIVVALLTLALHLAGGWIARQIPFATEKAWVGDRIIGLQAVVAELGSPVWCRLHGRYVAGEITASLAEADLAIATYLPNSLAELRLPAKLLEAVSVGVPAICRDLHAIRHYFDESCVYFFRTEEELAAQLLLAASDYPEAERRARNARNRLRGITWDVEGPRFARFVEATAVARVIA